MVTKSYGADGSIRFAIPLSRGSVGSDCLLVCDELTNLCDERKELWIRASRFVFRETRSLHHTFHFVLDNHFLERIAFVST